MGQLSDSASQDLHDAHLRDLADTRHDLASSVVLPQHLWVAGGRGGVAPLDTTLGVGGFHAPPIWAPRFALRIDLRVNGLDIIDAPGGFRLPEPGNGIDPNRRALLQRRRTWQLDRIVRAGHVHCRTEQGILSLEVISELAPLVEAPGGFAMTITVRNRCDLPLEIEFRQTVEPGPIAALAWSDWVWLPPAPTETAQWLEPDHFAVGEAHGRVNWDARTLHVPPQGQAATAVQVTVAVGDPMPTVTAANGVARASEHQARRVRELSDCFPSLMTNHQPLAEYWRRCLVTFMTCLWDHERFACRPHLATGGIDGRSICTYFWDSSYAPWVLHLLSPEALRSVIDTVRRIDVHEHFAFTPDGRGTGPWYAANDQALTELIWTDACVNGVNADLVGYLRDTLGLSEQRLPALGELKDFGVNRNLLEMRTSGYEHAVPCFNSMRAMNLRRLATLMDLAGIEGSRAWRQKADRIVREVRKRLWDPARGWFDCLHPDGSRHHVESIQIFDVMLAEVATAGQERALLSRLVDGDFLAPYGVHSVSPRDELHFELVDVDWSGNGAFIGEPPLLAYTLWKRGFAKLAWQVMQRLLWMGSMLPYLPQETYACKPSASLRGTANNIDAMAGIRAILSGMLGIEPSPEGTLSVRPQLPPGVEVQLQGLRWRGRLIDIHCRARHTQITIDGKRQPDGVTLFNANG